ncbi:MAG: hypothetical protein OEW31_02535 [Thermoleophilia bacterium]|nr:hypothetical protein [Thermoleophilia bacterium]
MYARVARFEGVEPGAMDAQIAEIEQSMAAAAAGQLPEGAPAEVQTLVESIVRYVQLVDRGSGTAYGIAFCESDDDAKRVHDALDAMSPSTGEGKRTAAGIFEVAVDQSF